MFDFGGFGEREPAGESLRLAIWQEHVDMPGDLAFPELLLLPEEQSKVESYGAGLFPPAWPEPGGPVSRLLEGLGFGCFS